MSVPLTVLGLFDRMAKIRQNAQANAATGDDFWTRVDAAADETFENRVKGETVTAIDTALANGTSGASFLTLLNLLVQYAGTDLALTDANKIQGYLEDYCAQRVSFEAGEIIAEAFGESLRLDPAWVFPKGTLVATAATQASAEMHEFLEIQGEVAESKVVDHDGALDAKVLGAVAMIVNQTATCSIATDLILTCTRQDGTEVDITTAALSASTQWAKTYVGQQTVGAAGAAAAQKVIPVAATAQFKVGEQVLIRTAADATVQEVGVIASIVAATSITMEANLKNSYIENDLVLPMFTEIAWKSGTMTQDKDIMIYAMPDRVIAL